MTTKARRPSRRIARPAVQPVIIEASSPDAEREDVGFIHVFTYRGKEYGMPERIAPAFALKAMDMLRHQGEGATLSWLLEKMFGPEGYGVLIDADDITKTQLRAIMKIVQEHVLGAIESGN